MAIAIDSAPSGSFGWPTVGAAIAGGAALLMAWIVVTTERPPEA